MKKKRLIIIAIIAILFLTISLTSTAENLKLHFIDVGQGSSILIQEPDGHNILVDGGDRAGWIADKIITYLKKQNVDKLDYIISTHPHADHIGGLNAVIDEFEIGKILDSGKIHTTQTYENYLLKIEADNIDFSLPRSGDQINIGSTTFSFLHPDQNIEEYSLNNASIVFMLKFKNQNFLFTGDIERKIEEKLIVENNNLKADLIKIPHHGSRTSSTRAFINEVQPEIAVIQVGADNRYDHPAAEVIELYQQLGTDIYRNDLNGDIVITADGNNYAVRVDRSSNQETAAVENQNNNEIKKTESEKSAIEDNKMNINQASKTQLQNLWGVGPATAENIIEYRENQDFFENIEEIKEVNGIDQGKFERWQNQITVD